MNEFLIESLILVGWLTGRYIHIIKGKHVRTPTDPNDGSDAKKLALLTYTYMASQCNASHTKFVNYEDKTLQRNGEKIFYVKHERKI